MRDFPTRHAGHVITRSHPCTIQGLIEDALFLFAIYGDEFDTQRLFAVTEIAVDGGTADEITEWSDFVDDGAVNWGRGLAAKDTDTFTLVNSTYSATLEHTANRFVSHNTAATMPNVWSRPYGFSNVQGDQWTRARQVSAYIDKIATPYPQPPPHTQGTNYVYDDLSEPLTVYFSTDSGNSFTEYSIADIADLHSIETWTFYYDGYGYYYWDAWTHAALLTHAPRGDGGMYVYVKLKVPNPEPTHTYYDVHTLFNIESNGTFVRREHANFSDLFYSKPNHPEITYHLRGATGYVYDWSSNTWSSAKTLPFTAVSEQYPDQFRNAGFLSDGTFVLFTSQGGGTLYRTTDDMDTWVSVNISSIYANSWGLILLITTGNNLIIPMYNGTLAVSLDKGDTWDYTATVLPNGNEESVTLDAWGAT